MFTKSYFTYVLNILIIITFNMQFTSATECGKDICLENTKCDIDKTSGSLKCFCKEGYLKVPDDKGIRCEKKPIVANGTDLKTGDNGENSVNVIGNENKSTTRSPEAVEDENKFFAVSTADSENIKDQNCNNGTDCLKTSEINSQEKIDTNENLSKSTTRSPEVVEDENKSFAVSTADTENIKDQNCTDGTDCLKTSEINSQEQIDTKENLLKSTTRSPEVVEDENKSFAVNTADKENIKDQNCTDGTDCLKTSEINSQEQIDTKENLLKSTTRSPDENDIGINERIMVITVKSNNQNEDTTVDLKESTSERILQIFDNKEIVLSDRDVNCDENETNCKKSLLDSKQTSTEKPLNDSLEISTPNQDNNGILDDEVEETSSEKTAIVLNDSGELDETENLGEINEEIEISTANTKICDHEHPCVDDVTESSSQPTTTTQNEQLKTLPNTDILGLFDFADDNVKCGKDEFLCRQKCCKIQNQICNKLGECIDKIYNDSKAEANTNNASLAYTIIGSVCIVTALGFILYKVYKFKRTAEY